MADKMVAFHWPYIQRSRGSSVQFSSVQFKIISKGRESVQFSSIQFSPVQDGNYALGKAHMHSVPPLRSFVPPNVAAFETVPMLV